MFYRLQHSSHFRLLLLAYLALMLFCILHFDFSLSVKCGLLLLLALVTTLEIFEQLKPLNKLQVGPQSFTVYMPQGGSIELKSLSVRPLFAGIILLRGRRHLADNQFFRLSGWGLLISSNSLSETEYLPFLRQCMALQKQELARVDAARNTYA
jgi:hypothetical protein|tara:strand:- start:1840 stop:2298 length:459 start_codon:yes stop_codon:yes gene_type:complete